ncbi:MAG: GNAT family N-acetyltransferase [Myxococcales bacterium]|nr:GNAT family N-acetyltransferase [Myxococcales bacterium]
MSETILETARLRLRRCTWDDLDHLVALDSDPEVMRYITGGVTTPRELYVEEVLPRWMGAEEHAGCGYWPAEDRQSGEFLGWFHLRPDRIEPEYLEIGYRLARAHWGRGLATEGSLALVERAFIDLGAEQVSARALLGNRASQRVMEKCGLRRMGEFDFPVIMLGDHALVSNKAVKYAITREQWLAARSG